MTSILTGDIINSREVQNTEEWLIVLKHALNKYGNEPFSWEIYRGDGFQLEISNPKEAFKAAIYIKASLKTIKNIDVRISIGIGEKNYTANKITQSNGEAFIFSGEKFEKLRKEKQNIAIQTKSEKLNRELNLYFKLALIAMDNWLINSAEFVKTYLENETLSQKELSELLGISQSSVSERYSRAYYAEIAELNEMYKIKIDELINYTK